MRNNNAVENFFKGLVLVILDLITFILLFTPWALVNVRVFPLALLAIFTSLVFLNIVVVFSKFGIEQFGVGPYISILAMSFLYYMFTLFFTSLTYVWILPKWYIIGFLLATLVDFGVISGLYTAGKNKYADTQRQDQEKSNVLDMKLLTYRIQENLKKSSSYLDKSAHLLMEQAFADMEERLKSSTPFGRVIKPIVRNVENDIVSQLESVNNSIISLRDKDDKEAMCFSIVESIKDIKSLIIHRENLIVQ